jgi:hypothetical protein
VFRHAPHPRTRATAAWGLRDYGDPEVVADVVDLWREMPDALRADLDQGGAVISFLSACGDPAGLAALADGLDARPPAVRELVVLAFADGGLGAVRGFAADPPEGVSERWPKDKATLGAIEALLVGRLSDLAFDPLGRIPRQIPICELAPGYDGGRRIADLAVRLLAEEWPSKYRAPDEPSHTVEGWETLRTSFLEIGNTAHPEEAPR